MGQAALPAEPIFHVAFAQHGGIRHCHKAWCEENPQADELPGHRSDHRAPFRASVGLRCKSSPLGLDMATKAALYIRHGPSGPATEVVV